MNKKKTCLFVGDGDLNGRHIWRLKELQSIYNVTSISLRSFARPYNVIDKFFIWSGLPLPDPSFTMKLFEIINSENDFFDMVWLDKAERLSFIDYLLLRKLKKRHSSRPRIVWFSEDNIFSTPEKNYRYYLHLRIADRIYTTKRSVYRRLCDLPPSRSLRVSLIGNLVFNLPPRPQESDYVTAKFDVLFFGAYENYRGRCLEALARRGFTVGVFGNGWSDKKNMSPNITYHGFLPLDRLHRVAPEYKIAINFFRKSVGDTSTTRPLEYASVGCCIVSEYSQDLSQIFKDGVDVFYFNDLGELLPLLVRLVSSDELRAQLRRSAFVKSQDFQFGKFLKREFLCQN